MTQIKYLHFGNEGAIYPVENKPQVVKAFLVELIASYKDNHMIQLKDMFDDLHSKKLSIPKVHKLGTINTSKIIIPNNFKKYASYKGVSLENKECPCFLRDYIEGISLDNYLLPSLKRRSLVRKLYSDFHDAGYIITDPRPSNFVLENDTNKLYLVDEGSVHSISVAKKAGLYASSIYGFNTFWSDKGLLAYYRADVIIKNAPQIIKSIRQNSRNGNTD